MSNIKDKYQSLLDFSFSHGNKETLANSINLSISGAQEKYSAILDKGKIRLTRKGEQGTYILKPAPSIKIFGAREIPANEYLTMKIASEIYGVNTAEYGMCHSADGELVYITKRYDIIDGVKYVQEDFAGVLGRNENSDGDGFKYHGSYQEIAEQIKSRIGTWKISLENFFNLVVFNYIFGNGDAHLKNYSLLYRNGEYFLAPAYDLVNTAVHLDGDDFALDSGLGDIRTSDTYDRTGHPCRQDFKEFALKIGISPSRTEKILDRYTSFPSEVYEMIENSYFSDDKLKRKYRRIIDQRQQRFNRQDKI